MKVGFLAFAAVSSLAFFSCGRKMVLESGTEVTSNAKMLRTAADSYAYSAPREAAVYADENLVQEADASFKDSAYEKKLVKTGNVSVAVEKISDSVRDVEKWTEGFGGYISVSSSSERSAWFTVRIPSARFDEAMGSAGNIGKVLSHSVNVEDVSEQYYDLESRMQNKKVMKEKLEGYLKSARDIKDLLQIEKELNSVISEIDGMEGRLKRLSGQVEYSTISLNLSLPSNFNDSGFIFPDFGNGFSDFLSAFISFLFGFVRVLFLVVLCGIPVLAVLCFFYWLLFGRIGLAFKIYRRLKGGK